jgi:predicted ATPase
MKLYEFDLILNIIKGLNMQLESVKYSEYHKLPNEWTLDTFTLSQINLLVAKNATGKTRTINLIRCIADLVCGDNKIAYDTCHWELNFVNGTSHFQYILTYKDSKITKEKYSDTDTHRIYLDRKENGNCTIWAVKENKDIEFHIEGTELACVSRLDKLQHPFFIDLNNWGKESLSYYFGTTLGKDSYAIGVNDNKKDNPSLKRARNVVRILMQAMQKHGDTFKMKIIASMEALGYFVEDIYVDTNPLLVVDIQNKNNPAKLIAIFVKEKDLNKVCPQNELSQGMFRCLSLLIQLHYAKMSAMPSLILIDDIGEGLDFERSVGLIDQVIKIVEGSSIQLIMSTNDRFVMNKVPLEYWCLIQRKQNHCEIFNYKNSKKLFDNFSFTGLSNFDFLSSDFISEKDSAK